MKKLEFIKLIKETVDEVRKKGEVDVKPGYKKIYRKGQGWIWVKKDEYMTGANKPDVSMDSEAENLISFEKKLDSLVTSLEADTDSEYSYGGSVYYYNTTSKQWQELKLNDLIRKNPINIVKELLSKTGTKEIEVPTSTNFKRAEELFDQFKGKSSDIFAYPNLMELDENGSQYLLRFNNSLMNAKKDLVAFDKFNSIESDDNLSGLKSDDEEQSIDVDKELSPSYTRRSGGVPDEANFDDAFMSGFNKMDESSKKKLINGLVKLIKEEIGSSQKKTFKTKKEVKTKGGTVIPVGTSVDFLGEDPQKKLPIIFIDGFNTKPITPSWKMFASIVLGKKEPSLQTLEKWSDEGYCSSINGKKVEIDGYDPDGFPSWMIVLGMV